MSSQDSHKIALEPSSETPLENISPNKASVIQRLNDECADLREKLTEAQNEKYEQLKTIQRQEGEIKLTQIKYQSLESELEQKKVENKQYLEAYEQERKQRLDMMAQQQSVLNNLNRDEAELNKYSNQNVHLKEQVQKLSTELQTEKTERVSAIRDKQNVANQIKLLETKLQAASMQAKYSKISCQELQNENKRIKEQLSSMKERVTTAESSPLQPQTIIKDSVSTTEKLLKEFEVKMHDKDNFLKKEIQSYEKKSLAYIARIAQLEGELAQKP